ncbi:MAG: Non-ribosomal peptide synthetase module [Benniella sp.]|nr:MAG: Non-ribosomal peptide synthetase module [Benniella sp.]
MTERNGQDSATALHAMDQPRVECENSLDDAKSTAIPHTLKAKNMMPLPLTDENVVEELSFGNGNITLPSTAPNATGQVSMSPSQAQYDYWRGILAGAPAMLDLPTDRPRVSRQSTDVSKIPIRLDAHLTLSLKQVAIEYEMDLSVVVMTGWSAVLARLSAQDDIIIGYHASGPDVSGCNQQAVKDSIWPLRLDLSYEPNISLLLERARKMASSSMVHQGLPLNSIAEIASSPLIQAVLRWDSQTSSHPPGPIQVELELQLQEQDTEITGNMLFSSDLFNPDTIGRHVGYLCSMLQAIVADVDRPVMSVALLSQMERDLLLEKWNKTEQAYPSDMCIHHLFEQQVEHTPQATALVLNSQSLTYIELNERANMLAYHLIGLGVRPESLVSICVERSFTMIVALLAVLKAGGAYVPLDPSYASERLCDIMLDANPGILVADSHGKEALGESVLSSVTVVDPNVMEMGSGMMSVSPGDLLTNPQVPGLTSRSLVYIIYTSGSTGKPKGVMVEHQGLVNLVLTRPEIYGIDSSSRMTQFFSIAFDAHAFDVFMTLCSGGSLHLLPDNIRMDLPRLWDYLERESITHTVLTPAVLQHCNNLPPLNKPLTLITTAEATTATLIKAMHNLIPEGTVVNGYGPTETTVSAMVWECPRDFEGDNVPIGRPIANKTIYLLDKYRQPVPIGAVGELYIGGVGVARGYLNRQELTSKVFLPDPFAGDKDARMYKTGDLARYLPDGNLVYIGRNDNQVKIRGFRIELGEIEARLNDHLLVQSSAVIAMGEGGHKRLVAYVVAKHDDQLVHTLRSHLTSCLPEYMVPTAIVRLDALPINSNGKLDRKALPAPDSDAFARQIYEAPQGDVEITIAHIWAEILNLDRVSRNDNFFALGGHSLLAVRLMNRLVSLDVQMPLSTIFASPTLLSFAESAGQFMGKERSTYSTIHSIPRDEDLPLSFSQQRMWFLAQMEGVSETYHMPMAVRLHGDLNRDAWQRALDTLFARHEALRSVFVTIDGQPQVRILSPQSGMPIRWEDLRGSPDTESQFERMSFKEAKDPFDLVQGPLIRVLMVQLDTNEHVCMVTQHHIVSDGWSSAIFNRELSTLYKAYCNGRSDPLPPLGIQYPDYAAWQRQWLSGDRLETHTTYWKTAFADAPVILNLPTDRPRPLEQSFAGDNIPIHLDSHLSRALKQLCQQHGVTLYMAVLAAWSCVLSRMSGQEDIVIGSPTANRNHHQFEPLIGLFVNTLALRIDVSGGPTVRQLLERVRKTSLDAQNHQDLPFEQVVDIVQPPRSLSYSPLFQVMFVLQNNEISEWNLPGLDVADANASYDIAKFDLTLGLYESDNEIVGGMSYSTALFDRATVERHVGYLCSMLQAMVEDVDRPVMSVDLLSKTERDLVLRQWNETQQDYPDHLCIHHLFEQQVERTPQATALVFNGQSITYAELNERANRLAHHLIGLGVLPETRVAICVERSIAMIVGVLAILKVGGAYVPLDPAFASERLRDILMDASPGILVADDHGRKALRDRILSTLVVVDPDVTETDSGSKCTAPGDSLPNPQIPGLTSRSLVYIIYTSGSTGKPKGVMVEHRGLVNLIMTRHDVYGISASSRVLQFFSFAFDGCVLDIFMALSYGGSLHLLPDAIRMDLPRLWDYLERESITQAILTPSVLQDCKNLPQLGTQLTLIVAGEAPTTSLLKVIHQLIPNGSIVNDYGPTEATVSAVAWKCPREFDSDIVPIGRPIANKTVYILDQHRQPVPSGVIGELYIGGIGVARGYLNRPELTANTFLPDPFAGDKAARMYKTGDLVRYLPDGNLVYHGRNDHQVKIRGFRIELGEVEARLLDHILVDEAAVIAIGEGSNKKLVGYVVSKPDDNLLNTLRLHLKSCLPEYMVPSAIVRLDILPINSNGKLDRKALPAPDSEAYARQIYEKPQGDTEIVVAKIWAELLHLDCVSRNDNFFSLGGHSLMAVQMIERLRRVGLTLAVSALFRTPALSALAQSLDLHHICDAPTNLIMSNTTIITPQILPLITLSQADIDHIVNIVPGGVANIQDIYPLSPLQEGIHFHHLLATEGDPYLLINLMTFETRELLDKYLDAIQMVVNRHDILRTAILYENLSKPAQVVWREASLSVTELHLEPSDGPIVDQLKQRIDPRRIRINLTQAPLLRFTIAQDVDGRWIVAQLIHHLIGDHTTLEAIAIETKAFMNGQGHNLRVSQPFRNLIAQARLSHNQDDHEKFFKGMLKDIDTPSLPFGLKDVHGQGDNVTTSYRLLPQGLNDRLRRQAKQLGVSVASLCHLALALVISRTSGESRVVFGTVLFGRMNSGRGSDSAMGLFINTLPLRVDLAGTVRESVLQTHERLASLLEHEHASLTLAQRCSEISPGTPLFSAMMNYRHNTTSADMTSIAPGIEYLGYQERTNYPFTLSVEDFGVSLGLTADVVQPFNPNRVCGYMQQALDSLVSFLEHAPDTMMTQELNILPRDEQELLIRTWNTTEQDYPNHLCIHHLFEQQVERTPQVTALVFNGQSLSYSELNGRANGLAHHLIGLGVQPDSLVAICVNRSFAMIVGVLAILKAGGAYVALDPSYPKERLAYILEDAAPDVALADTVGHVYLREASQHIHGKDITSIVMIDPFDHPSTSVNPEAPGLTSRHLAYIIYTSGSTGRPKGVMVEHQGVVNYTLSRIDDYALDISGKVLQFASLNFDLSVMEIFTALSSGASLHLLEDHTRLDRRELWGYLEQHMITQAILPPAILQECKNCSPLSAKLTLISTGEELSATLLRDLQRLIPNGCIVNECGATEVTVNATSWRCPRDFNSDAVPIGRPFANMTIYLLDKYRQPVPIGAVGELYIGGVGVARGYLNQPELTAKAFLPDPFAGDKDARMYKTGDLARYLPDGNLLYLGRNDHQVKIRGFRIELGEIEACLSDHPLVQSTTVVVVGNGSNKSIVAYVGAEHDDRLVHILRSHLTSILPEYMVPAAIVRLDSLPINSNGKLDRKALPAPDSEAYAHQVYEKPYGDTEIVVAKIWAELLHLDRVSRNDNFFALGGHSLLAVRMIERLRRIGLTLAVSALFKTPTLSALVQSLDISQICDAPTNLIMPNTTTITPEMLPLITLSQTDIDHIVKRVRGGVANIQDIYALSPLQEGILFHHLLATEGDPYLLIDIMAFETRELLDKYLDAIQMVMNRHDILRTAIVYENLSTPAQVVWREASLSVTELHLEPSDGPIVDQLKQRIDPRRIRINLTQAPLLRFTIAQDADGRWIVAQLLHHLIGDHTTLEVTSIEVKAFMNGQGRTLPAPQPFRNLIAQARLSHSQDDHERFFKEMLKDIDTPSLPFGLKDVHGQGDNVTTSYRPLPQGLNDRLRKQAKQLGVSVASLCHLAWALVISRTSGESRVVFGTVLFGRMNSGRGSGSAMGLFINTLPLRVDLTGTVRESLLQTHKHLASLLEHEHASLTLAQRCSEIAPGIPLFSAMINYRHNATSADVTSIAPGIEFLEYQERTNYPFSLSVEDFGASLGLTADVVQPFNPNRVCGYMQQALESLVSALEYAPGMATNGLKILPEDEQELLLRTWNTTQQDYSDNLCIHHLFEQQAERTPQATALVFNGYSMTYAELNKRSNRLAQHLISLGVRPEIRVAICVERSIAMIVGVLAILKVGGAYVPLDPAFASERLRDILMDASPGILVADDHGRKALRDRILSTLVVVDPDVTETDSGSKCTAPGDSLPNPQIPGLTSRSLVYIIYTSGSTGKPKGVMVEHQGLVNLVLTRPEIYGIDSSSRMTQFFSIAFDAHAFDVFMTLCSGGSLHLLPDNIRMDLPRLWDYLERESITHTVLTPAVLQHCNNLPPLNKPLTLITTAEATTATLIKAMHNLIPEGTVVNGYGPTETTVSAMVWECPRDFEGDNVPIGRPIANKTIYLLDKYRQPVPIGAVGELYIGGVGVARGYLNRQELTSKVFLPDPFAGDKDARMYKTGDLARYLPDGNLVYIGRNDNQVKIRGFRIELGEIEARLNDHLLVQSSAVIAMGEGGHKRLVAYVVAKHDDQLVHTLRSHLTSCLPEYMVPTAIVRLDALPINSNGKLDRKALPAPDSDAFARQIYEAPQGDVEITIAHIWAEILNLDRVSRNDNFFALGGHSLLAVRLMNRLVSLDVQMPLSTIFASPTLLSFAESAGQFMGKERSTYSTIHSIPRDEDLPLSFSQQRMWFLAQMEGVSETYHMPMAVRLHGDLNRDAWQRALDTLFARHEALRSVFVTIDGQPQVRILSPQSGMPIRWEDLRGSPDTESQFERMSFKEAKDPFDLVQGPLIRVLMVQLDTNEHVCMVTQHHIVSDGWSSAIFNRELSTLYKAYCNGRSDPLPPLGIQYPDYAAWQRQWLSGDRLETHTTYWKTAFADAPVILNLPTDRPRPLEQSFAGDNIPIHLDSHLSRALKQLCQQHGVTLYMAVLAAWSCVLSRMSGQEDIVIGSPTANRNHHQFEPLIGLFINILALRIDVSGEPTVRQLLERVRKTSLDAQNHQDLPFEQVVDIVQPPRSLSYSPLFQVMFVLQNNEISEWNLPGLDVADANASYDIAKFDLTLGLYESDNEIVGGMSYSTALFDRATVERHVGYLCSMLQAMVEDVDRPVMSVDLLSKTERDLVLRQWNETQQDYPDHLCIHHLFEQQVERTPQATALVFNGQSITYAELNERANRLAHHLIGLGVRPDSLVAICVERSFAMIVGILGILKAGGAYVPLDPAYASNRLRDILFDASPSIAVVDIVGNMALGETVSSMMVVDQNELHDLDPQLEMSHAESITSTQRLCNPQVSALTPYHLAYIIYTSGSTGKPKGVMIEHRGVVNLIHERPESFGISTSSRALLFASLSFDHSVSEIFSALTGGACLHLVEDEIRFDRLRLWEYLKGHSISHVSITPTLLQDSNGLPPLKVPLTLVVMGEALPASLIPQLQKVVPNGKIINDYGPTEITVAAIIWKCPQSFNNGIVPIGRPFANKKAYILDKNQQPVPIGAVGELYIGGVGVARGYLNRPDLTSMVFLPDPFVGDKDARMYKTGDLARYLPDGNIIFLGRSDHQVKIRGFRIELGEIEARLNDHPLVDKAAVIAFGEGSDKRLVGYVVTKPDDTLVKTLRTYLTSCLPEYMVPAAIVRLDSLPTNSNGKLDHKALPVPDSDAFARQIYDAPQGDVETTIAHIWAEVLNIDRVSRNDNFFALGGHSLLAVRLMNRLVHLGVQIPLSTIFARPTLLSFAESAGQFMGKERSTYSTIRSIPRDEDLPLSFSQQRMWFLAQMEGVSETYHMPMAVRLHGDLNRDAWQRALDTLFARHEALRSVFVTIDGQPQVRLLSPQSGMPIRWEDLRGSPDTESQFERMSFKEAKDPFDLVQGPLIRVLMVQLDTNEHVCMVTQHHIVSDGWSSAIFNRELSTLYKAYCNGRSDPLPPLGIQPRPLEQSFAGDNIPIHLDSHLSRALKQLCQQHGVTLYMAVLAAWSCVLSRMSGQEDIVIGSPTANRNHHQFEPLIGLFVNTLALRIDVSGGPTVRQLLERVRKTSLDAQNHQDLPFEQVVDIVQPPRSLSYSPLFQVMFVLQNNEISEWNLPGLDVADANASYDIAKFDLTLGLYESDNEIVGGMSYSTALFDRATVERHVGYLCSMLQAMVEDVDRPVMSVDLLSKTERDLVLRQWNETQQDYPDHLCIHHLFEQQVERTPQATALVFNGQSITYAELNERANRLAHHLIGLGVLPETRVAICVERSIAMIVGVLAILKVGGAYVPLDPAFASERLRDILMDASPGILVADDHGRKALRDRILSTLVVVDPDVTETDSGSKCTAPGDSLPNPQIPGLTSRSLVYIIYTSGSTGKPKGVMVEHRGLVNLIMTRHDVYGISASSRVLQFFSFAFDGCVLDIFMALSYGGSLHLLPDAIRMDLPRLWDYLERESITQAILTPSVLQDCKNLPQLGTQLTLIVAGEAPTTSLLKVIHQLIPNGSIVNDYGPTEATVSAVAWKCPREFDSDIVPIGRPIANKTVYILDQHRQPVPSGVIGELYIGGIGVARGYLNRPELTANTFLPDPFAGDKAARMYKTGDLVRYLPDGNLVYHGRNDHQVKIRGFRIELGEVEARLLDHILVDEAAVIAIGEGSNKKLVGYVVSKPDDNLLNTLRLHLKSCLPEYMVPSAIVRLDILPINSNGKLDRKALPAPDSEAYARQIYEKPQGDTEIVVAKIWAELLHLDCVSRNDNFFSLGGHSLMAVQMIERLRRVGLTLAVSALFRTPALSALAQSLDLHHICDAPTNLIMSNTTIITPQILPLITLSQADIDHIVNIVPGGVANIQDIYPLSPLQEGIHFHHLLATEGDPYLLINLMTFETRELLDKYLDAIQMVVNRHDILRTAILYENLSKPAQVVWREASLSVTELHLEPSDGPIVDQLKQRIDPRRIRINLTQAPLLRFTIAQDVDAFMNGQGHNLRVSQPFRNLIAQARLSHNQDDHEKFKGMLKDIDTPSLPFGLKDVHGQGDNVTTSYRLLPQGLNDRLRRQAKQLGRDGSFINTLPLRVDLAGTVRESVLQTHERLASLLEHEHASLTLAQRCSEISPGTPLFSAMMNYRHNTTSADMTSIAPGIEYLGYQERTNYPFTLSVEDFGVSLGLTADVVQPFNPNRVCGYMQQALDSLVSFLEHAPDTMMTQELNILPRDEQELLIRTWNTTEQDYPNHLCIHHLFEQQVERTPQVTALVFNGQSLSYSELNGRVLAILKAGGAYVALDPSYPKERLAYILEDAAPDVALADTVGHVYLREASHISMGKISPPGLAIRILELDLSVMEIFTALSSGASLHLLEDHTRLDRRELWGYLEQHMITQAILPPAILQECKNCSPLSAKLTLISTGEELRLHCFEIYSG